MREKGLLKERYTFEANTLNMLIEIALSAGYAIFFWWLIGRSSFFNDKSITHKTFQWLFLIKLIAGFGLFLVYTRYYPDRRYADIFRYYDDSKILFDSIWHRPYDFFRMMTGYHSGDPDLWQYYNPMHNWFNSEMIFNDSRTMIRLNALFRFASAGTYYPHAILFCFLGFTGLCAFYKTVASEFNRNQHLLAAGIFLTPSILLWTSGVIKETFLVFTIGCLLYALKRLALKQGSSRKNLLITFCCMFFLLNIKSYMLFAILPALITWYIIKARTNTEDNFIVGNKESYRKLITVASPYVFVYIVYFVLLFQFSPLITHHPVPELLKNKQEEFYNLARVEKAGSVVSIPILEPNGYSLAVYAPGAFLLTLTRPFLWEADNAMMLPAALENTFIVLLIVVNFIFLFRNGTKLNGLSFMLLSVLVVITLFCLIGWVTPILGAVVRYKVAALPFLIVLLFCHSGWEKWDLKLKNLVNGR
jgi:hypothetical protein